MALSSIFRICRQRRSICTILRSSIATPSRRIRDGTRRTASTSATTWICGRPMLPRRSSGSPAPRRHPRSSVNGLPPLLRRAVQIGVEQLFPARCGVCGSWGELLCAGCAATLPLAEGPRCAVCWSPGAQSPCDLCALGDAPCTAIRAVYAYDDGVRPLVAALKYRGVSAYARPLGALMAERWPAYGFSVDVIVPVPLHPRRERWRGYNQSGLLAGSLGERLPLPVRQHALRR